MNILFHKVFTLPKNTHPLYHQSQFMEKFCYFASFQDDHKTKTGWDCRLVLGFFEGILFMKKFVLSLRQVHHTNPL